MFLQWMWFSMMLSSLLFACVTGSGGLMLTAALDGTKNAIEVTLRLGAGYLFFCGMMEIAGEAGISAKLEKGLKPLLRRLMPHMGKASEAVTMNLSMNMLGLGNAATPMGIQAAKRLKDPNRPHLATDELCRLIVLNTASIQLIPANVAAVRASLGAASPFDILPAVWVTSLCSAGLGLLAAWGMGAMMGRD